MRNRKTKRNKKAQPQDANMTDSSLRPQVMTALTTEGASVEAALRDAAAQKASAQTALSVAQRALQEALKNASSAQVHTQHRHACAHSETHTRVEDGRTPSRGRIPITIVAKNTQVQQRSI